MKQIKIIALLLTIGTIALGAGYIKNSDIAATADIALSKLEPVAAGEVVIGNVTGDATHVPMSGEVTIDATGATVVSNAAVIAKVITGFVSGAGTVTSADSILSAIQKIDGNITAGGPAITALTGDVTATGPGSVAATIANNAVTNAKILNGTIDLATKVTGTLSNGNTSADSTNVANTIVSRDASGNFAAGTISAALTGNSSTSTALAANPTDCGAGTKAISIDASGNLSCSVVADADISAGVDAAKIADGTVSNTEFQYINSVTSNVQTQLNSLFTLPSLTSGSVLFSNGTTISQDNTNYCWDDTNNRSGIGTCTPGYRQHIKMATATSTDAIVWEGSGAGASRYWHWMPDSSGYLYMKNLNEAYYSMVFDNAGRVGFGTASHTAQLNVVPRQATIIPAIFKGFAAQTADLTEWQDSASTVLSKIDSTGKAFFPGAQFSGLTASLPVKTDASKNLSSGAIDLASAEVTGVLPAANLPAPTSYTISASDVDWSLSKNVDSFYEKTLSANTTLTFSNMTKGQTIVIMLTNTASNYTVAWPAGAKWSGGTAPTQTIGAKMDIYTCKAYSSTAAGCTFVQNYTP